MPKITNASSIPVESIIAINFQKIHYADSFSIPVKNRNNYKVDSFFKEFGKFDAKWIKGLMYLRDFLVRFAGLKPGNLKEKTADDLPIKTGASFGPFKILTRNEIEIIFYENDKHLNFRSSILLLKQNDSECIHSITLVHFNNVFGRIYFFFVKPFHRLIVKAALKKVGAKY